MVLKIIIYKGSEILSGILKRQHTKFPLVLKKRHSFADVNEKREREMMVMLPLMHRSTGLMCLQSSLVSQVLAFEANFSIETFFQNTERFPAQLPREFSHSGQKHYQSSTELQVTVSPFSSKTDPSPRGREVGKGRDAVTKMESSNDL